MKDDIVTPTPTTEANTALNTNEVVSNPADSSQSPTTAPAQSTEPQSDVNTTKTEEIAPQAENNSVQQNQKKPKKKRGSRLVISFALLIMVGLVGLAVYVGIFANKSSDSSKNSSKQSSQNSAQKAEEDKNSINQLAAEAESLPDDQDDSGNGLSDDQLGL